MEKVGLSSINFPSHLSKVFHGYALCGLHLTSCYGWDMIGAGSQMCGTVPWCGCLQGPAQNWLWTGWGA